MRTALISASLLLPAGGAFADPTPGRAEIERLQKVVKRAARKIEPSVVMVCVSRNSRHADLEPAGVERKPGELGGWDVGRLKKLHTGDAKAQQMIGRLDLAGRNAVPPFCGSGVVVADSGLVLTDFPLVRGAVKIYVRVPGGGGSYADIHAADGRSGLAVLRMRDAPKKLRPLVMAGKTPEAGQWLVGARYTPMAGFRNRTPAVGWGTVSAVRRKPVGRKSEYEGGTRYQPLRYYGTLIQTDVRMNLGVAGAAVANLDGELVGLTTASAGVLGEGEFVTPAAGRFRKIVRVLMAGREVEYGFLGVSTDRRFPRNLVLGSVTSGSPAERGGLRPGDRIVAVDGTPVRTQDDLFLTLGTALAGNVATLKVDSRFRAGPIDVPVRLVKYPYVSESIVSRRPPAVHGLHVDYASTLTTDGIPRGVLVTRLEPGTPAARKLKALTAGGARVTVTAVDGEVVDYPEDFRKAAARSAGSVTLTVRPLAPGGRAREITLP